MKKFKFKLEPVAKLRRLELEQQGKKVAEITNHILQLEKRIHFYNQAKQEEILRIRKEAENANFASQLGILSRIFQDNLTRQIKLAGDEIRQAQFKLAEERKKLIEKETKKQVIDKLKEKAEEKHDEFYRRIEAHEMDEISSSIWSRRHP